MKSTASMIFYFLCALVAIAKAQDISLMFQALGMEAPMLPPSMPKSLRDHISTQRVAKMKMMQMVQRQRQQLLAIRAAQLRESAKANPYSAPYNVHKTEPTSRPTVLSGANAIRRPGQAPNTVSKVNPYAGPNNPYSTSRAASSRDPNVRRAAAQALAASLPKVLASVKRVGSSTKKIKDAKMAGCKLPVDNTAASVLMFSTCRSPAAKMVCSVELMQCSDVGMTAMCCPPGINNLAIDTISYVNKLQHYMAEMA